MTTGADSGGEQQPEDLGNSLFGWLMNVHVMPELDRRVTAGEMPEGEPVYRAQVLFFADAPTQVRVNEEVSGHVMAVAARAIEKGEEVTVDDMAGISSYELAEEDRDAAHFSAFLHRDGWSVAFDGRVNRNRAQELVGIADEFVMTAASALGAGNLRAFSENAFAAAELLATAELSPLPDARILSSGHGFIGSLYNLWAKRGNTEQRFAGLFNKLARRRHAARYARKPLRLTVEQAAAELDTLQAMREHVHVRAHGDATAVAFQFIAHRDLRGGEVVGMPPGGAVEMLGGGSHKGRGRREAASS